MRTVIDLNGVWDFVADLDPKYHSDPRIYPAPPFADPVADRRHWMPAPVPGVWQTYAERYDIFEGVGWFAREFDLPAWPPGAAARLRFDGVNYLCRVFVNGAEAGAHEGGYTAFEIDVSGLLRAGRNHLAVMVDNRAANIRWPPVLGYFNYGGIHRAARLEVFDGPGFDDLRVEAVPASTGGLLRVRGRVRGPRPGLRLTVDCAGAGTDEPIPDDGAFETELWAPGAELWSPDAPRLHEAAIALHGEDGAQEDAVRLRCGFRGLSLREGRVCVNGQALALKGVCYVYDSPVHGLVMAPGQVEADLRLMKEAGCNAVRCHYPMDAAFYDACDRLGLLAWIEPPVYCYHPADDARGTAFSDPGWAALAEGMASEMIAAARNHPSVAIYSIGNECNTRNPEAEPFFRRLAAVIREADPTRLVSYAALYGIVGPAGGLVDVLGINSYWGWYDQIGEGLPVAGGGPAECAPRPIDLAPMRAMLDEALRGRESLALLLTEFGADSVAGFHSRGRDLWSEEYHADLLRAIFALADEYPQIAGTFPFCFSDYRDPSKVHNGYWREWNLKGVVTYERRKKKAFEALRERYAPQ